MIRGIGIGLIAGAVLMYFMLNLTGNNVNSTASGNDSAVAEVKQTEEKVTEKATTEEATTEEATTEEKTTEEATTEEETTEEATTEEVTTEEETTEEVTTEEATTEEKTTEEATTEEKTTEEKTTEEATTEEKKADSGKGDTKSITVTSGMGSEEISALLKEAGLVESATDYNSWLISKGYDSKLHIGTFEIKTGSSNEDIAKILTTQGH